MARIPIPHPAGGSAPDLMQLLAEVSTLQPPHPDLIPRQQQGSIRDLVNNPQWNNKLMDQPDLAEVALNLSLGEGGGYLPKLNRSMIESLSDAHLRQLDTEADLNPSLSRMLMQQSEEPGMFELMDQAMPAAKLSSYFGGASPVDQPDVIQAKVEELLAKLDQLLPETDYGKRASVEEIITESEPYTADHERGLEMSDMNSQDGLRKLLRDIRLLSKIAQQPTGPDQVDALRFLLSKSDTLPQYLLEGGMANGLLTSGLGQTRRVPGLDPASQHSLAPDIDPQALQQLAQRQDPEADTDLMLEMMGLAPNRARRNV